MAIYFYSEKLTEGLPALLSSLQATRLRYHDGMNFRVKGKIFEPKEGDTVICWGRQIPAIEGVRVLNASATAFSDSEHALFSMHRLGLNIPVPQQYAYKSMLKYEQELAVYLNGEMPASGLIPHKHIPMLGIYPVAYAATVDVHIVGDEIISSTRTLKDNDVTFQHRAPTGRPAERFIAELRALKLDFGVFQVLRTGTNNDKLVLNDFFTAPALGDWQVPLYEKAFRQLIETPIKQPIVEIEQPIIDEPVAAAPRIRPQAPRPMVVEPFVPNDPEDFEDDDEPEDDE